MPTCQVDNDSYQKVSDAIINQCEALNLNEQEIAVCLANTLLALVTTSQYDSLSIENIHGSVSVLLHDKETI